MSTLLLAGCGGGGGRVIKGGAQGEAATGGQEMKAVGEWWDVLRGKQPEVLTAGRGLRLVPALSSSEQVRAEFVQKTIRQAICAGAGKLASGAIGHTYDSDRAAWRSFARAQFVSLYTMYPATSVDALANATGDWLFGQTNPVEAGNVCVLLRRSGL